MGGGSGGGERDERAAWWRSAVVRFSGCGGSEADIDFRAGRPITKCKAASLFVN